MPMTFSTRVFLWGIGGSVGLSSTLLLGLLLTFPRPVPFISILAVWVGFLVLLDRYLLVRHNRPTALPLSLSLAVALVGLLLTIGSSTLQWLMVILGGALYGGLFTAALFRKSMMQHGQKRIRRIMMMYWTFALYGIMATLFSVVVFFQHIPLAVIALLGGAVGGVVSWILWKEYVGLGFRQGLLWIMVMLLFTIELMWATFFLPTGYLTNALFVVWPWYLAQLLIRFSFTRQGILWPRQLMFLSGNALLYACVLFFFVRWQ